MLYGTKSTIWMKMVVLCIPISNVQCRKYIACLTAECLAKRMTHTSHQFYERRALKIMGNYGIFDFDGHWRFSLVHMTSADVIQLVAATIQELAKSIIQRNKGMADKNGKIIEMKETNMRTD